MDFKSKFVKNSIQGRLTLWLSAIITIVAISGMSFAYYKSMDEARELQDGNLTQIANIFDKYGAQANNDALGFDEYQISILKYPSNLENCKINSNCIRLPNGLQNGLSDYSFNKINYRILIKPLKNGDRIAILQKTNSRDEAARYTTLLAGLPLVLLYLILLICIIIAIKSAFEPIHRFTKTIEARKDGDYSQIQLDEIPLEILPFLQSINSLMEKISISLNSQKELVANAAHELRTPLTALSLQIENLSRFSQNPEADAIITKSKNTIKTTKHLIENLLDYSRASSPQIDGRISLDIVAEIRNLIELYLPIIESRELEIIYDGADEMIVHLPKTETILILKNLLDNAIKFSPDREKIYICAINTTDKIRLTFENASEKSGKYDYQSLLKPFVRENRGIIGSGLGLAIVEKAVSKINGNLHLTDAQKFEYGFKVEINFKNYSINSEI